MTAVAGMGTTFNLPNFTGELFDATPNDTPFLSTIGGLYGGESTGGSTLFNYQFFNRRPADGARQRTEGATVTGSERKRYSAHNVVEIHQESVELSYTKLAAIQQLAGSGSNHPNGGSLNGSNPVTNELDWQIKQKLIEMAADIEVSFITGEFANPSDNTNPRETRGLIQAITQGLKVRNEANNADVTIANEIDANGEFISLELLNDALQSAWENGGLAVEETRSLMVGAFQKRKLTEVGIIDAGYVENRTNAAGVNVQQIETDFGRVNIVLNRHVPADAAIVCSMEECKPRVLEIPGKGAFFLEEKSQAGASVKCDIYGEIGLESGDPLKHAVITDLADTNGS